MASGLPVGMRYSWASFEKLAHTACAIQGRFIDSQDECRTLVTLKSAQ